MCHRQAGHASLPTPAPSLVDGASSKGVFTPFEEASGEGWPRPLTGRRAIRAWVSGWAAGQGGCRTLPEPGPREQGPNLPRNPAG